MSSDRCMTEGDRIRAMSDSELSELLEDAYREGWNDAYIAFASAEHCDYNGDYWKNLPYVSPQEGGAGHA